VIFFPSLVAPILENDIERRSRHSWVVYSASWSLAQTVFRLPLLLVLGTNISPGFSWFR